MRIFLFAALAIATLSTVTTAQTGSLRSASALIKRVLPAHASQVVVEPLTSAAANDTFELETINGRLHIRANTPVAAAAGLNWYFENVAHVTISWVGDQMSLPKQLPPVPTKTRITSPFKYRYYLNYCTHSYSMAFWDWPRWERELDWMALHGINLPLAITGTEAVWQRTLRKFNFSEDEIKAFIPGPGFTAWWLMGNLEGWGGTVSQAWIDGQVKLQQKIVARMREFGMKPVFQGFYGMVPNATRAKYPQAKIIDQGLWLKFTRPAILLPSDPLFADMARVYYDELRKLYGNTEFYGGDPFHEGGSTKGIDLSAAAAQIQKAMTEKQPDAVWVLQGWSGNPKDGLLNGLDKKRTLVLDLANDRYPQWKKRNAWNGYPWVYSIISNFGENTGMFGRLDLIAKDLPSAMADSSHGDLTGIGIMLEGINNNPVVYDHLLSFGFRADGLNDPANLDEWLKNYANYRYGLRSASVEQAWDILRKTVYNAPSGRDNGNESVFCARPTMKFTSAATWGAGDLYYDRKELVKALGLMLDARDQLKNVETYRYDVTDLTRQVLTDLGKERYFEMIDAFNKKDAETLEQASSKFLELLRDEERILATRREFLVGTRLKQAWDSGTNPSEKALFVKNQKFQITIWSPIDTDLHEYAHKEWSGLMHGLYLRRWQMFVDELKASLREKREPRTLDYFTVEKKWAESPEIYSSAEQGETLNVALDLYKKYE